jgi:hypothetical protein
MKIIKTPVDIVAVKGAVQHGKLRVFERNGFYMLEDTISGEVVRLNECEEVTHSKSYFDDSELSSLGF